MYRIFLSDNSNYVELDTEDISMETVFSISDISDISSRKDTITKNITFKGTQTNNKAFGYHFFFNKHVDSSIDNRLFFNYIPSHKVDCKVFEDSVLIINGTMLLTSANIDKDGNINYDTIVTGKIVSLKSALGDSLLEDLDFTDLKHQYLKTYIAYSWGISSLDSGVEDKTQRYNPDTDTYFLQDFELGSGYVYPFIDYGEKFKNETFNNDYINIPLHNYRPAIYVKEYMNRIFKNAGYTYELKADSEFIERFNRLIIPDAEERLTTVSSGNVSTYSRDDSSPAITQETNQYNFDGLDYSIHPLSLPIEGASNILTTYGPALGKSSETSTIIMFKRPIKTDISVQVQATNITNRSSAAGHTAKDATIKIEIAKRAYSTDVSDNAVNAGWDIIGSTSFTISEGDSSTYNNTFNIITQPIDFAFGDQIMIRLICPCAKLTGEFGTTYSDDCTYSITDISLSTPKNETTFYTTDAQYNDYITPKAPENVKQIDFLKSILTLVNLYVYNNNDNPTHLYLQPYDDFYSLCNPPYLVGNALNWTGKIDYSKGLTINSNLDLPTKYNFSFKEDSDYLNKTYKDRYGEVYGTLTAEDSSGLSDEKQVNVIFSPTPMVIITGQNRLYGFMADGGTSLADKQVMKPNIRILFYNGGAFTNENTINYSEDVIDSNGEPTVESRFTYNIYGQASNYQLQIVSDTVNKLSVYNFKYDIHFGQPKEYYFISSENFGTLPTSYSYYSKQIQEMIDPNIFTIECTALLNSVDIGNLDFRNPVFIDTGKYGHAYFKILDVEYSDSTTSSTITLQKIIL